MQIILLYSIFITCKVTLGKYEMKKLIFLPLYAVSLLLWSASSLAGSWNIITSEEFVEKLSDKSQTETETQQLGSLQIVRQKLYEVNVFVLFNSGSIEIADSFSRKQLNEVGKALSSKSLSMYSFEIAGHTDSIGPEAANLNLSQQRADVIKNYLFLEHSIPPERLKAKGYGESMPVASNKTIAGRAKNRRVVIKRLK